MKSQQRSQIEVGEHITIDDEEGVDHPGLARRKADCTSGVQRGRFRDVGDLDVTNTTIGIGLDESVGQIAQTEDNFGDSVLRHRRKDVLNHRRTEERQHLLRHLIRQRAKARAFAADEDDRLHD